MEEKTAEFARNFSKTLKSGDILLLSGDLGAGKTVFARAVIRALCQNEALEVPSPTFTLVQYYEGAAGPVTHFDLYRLENPEEIYELGWEEALAEGITLVEWPQRLKHLKPARALDISFANDHNDPHTRIITYS